MQYDTTNGEYTDRMEEYWSPTILSKGFVSVPIKLIECRQALGLSTTEFVVLVTLCSYRYSNRPIWPAVKSISKRSGVDVRSVYRATSRLENLGLIGKERQEGQTTLYDLNPLTEELESLFLTVG